MNSPTAPGPFRAFEPGWSTHWQGQAPSRISRHRFCGQPDVSRPFPFIPSTSARTGLAYNCIVSLPNLLGNFPRRLGLPKAIRDWSLRSLQVKLIKTGGRLVRHARRLVFQLAEVAVPRAVFQGVLERIGGLCPAPD